MKIALDPWMVRDRPFDQICQFAAEHGYRWIELSPRDDFLPLYVAPQANRERVQDLKASLKHRGVGLASLWTVYDWSDPNDSGSRQTAIAYWKQVIQIALELDCPHLNSEFSGRPESFDNCKVAFRRSMEELVPVLEKAGIVMSIEPHPGDFVEDGNTAVDLIKAIGSPSLRYLYCAPHTFHMGGDLEAMLRYASPVLDHVHVADTLDHRIPVRYIINPPGSAVRVHQHTNIGEGEVDWDAFFRTLGEFGFDGIMTNSVFAWPDRAEQSALFMLKQMNQYLSQYLPRANP
ncbi:MAG: sugar phosphate isomerase/epimerase [Terriglobia bacterium]